MILADTSVWADHLRSSDPTMERLLGSDAILVHPLIIGEIAMGSLHRRAAIFEMLRNLQPADVAEHDEVLALVEREHLFSLGINYFDAHLLASTLLTAHAGLWTRDRRLHALAERMGVAGQPWGHR